MDDDGAQKREDDPTGVTESLEGELVSREVELLQQLVALDKENADLRARNFQLRLAMALMAPVNGATQAQRLKQKAGRKRLDRTPLLRLRALLDLYVEGAPRGAEAAILRELIGEEDQRSRAAGRRGATELEKAKKLRKLQKQLTPSELNKS